MNAFQAFNPNGKPILLHVGAGSSTPDKLPKVFKEYHEVRLDIDPRCKPDIVSSMTRMKLVDDNSVDAIWCSHALEHLANHEVQPTLREWRRVLKNGGYVVVTMPDIQKVAGLVAQGKLLETIYVSQLGPITPLDMIFGHTASIELGQEYMRHKTGFSSQRLKIEFSEADYKDAQIFSEALNLWGIGFKSTSDPRKNAIIHELYEAIKGVEWRK